MNFIRTISYFDKTTEQFVGETTINSSVNYLENIFQMFEDDYNFILIYEIDTKKAEKLRKTFGNLSFDINKFSYFLETTQV